MLTDTVQALTVFPLLVVFAGAVFSPGGAGAVYDGVANAALLDPGFAARRCSPSPSGDR